jgi:hypothetical protein
VVLFPVGVADDTVPPCPVEKTDVLALATVGLGMVLVCGESKTEDRGLERPELVVIAELIRATVGRSPGVTSEVSAAKLSRESFMLRSSDDGWLLGGGAVGFAAHALIRGAPVADVGMSFEVCEFSVLVDTRDRTMPPAELRASRLGSRFGISSPA